MSEHEASRDGQQALPPLLRFLGLHLALGAAIGIALVSLMLLGNLAGLKKLIVEAQNPFIPLLLLYSFNIITFSSVAMGIGIMTMPLEEAETDEQALEASDQLLPLPIETKARRRSMADLP